MKIIIAGGNGFIGRKLTDYLLEKGHEIVILSRNEKPSDEKIKYIRWLEEGTFPEKEIERADAIINLAGVSINEGRWTAKHQKQIYDSRMIATSELVRIIDSLPEKPSVFINASAIGIYPPSEQAVYSERSSEVADDFLGRTVHDWEKNAARVAEYGIRTVFMRFGVVLGKEGGALPLMVFPYKLFLGGTVGSGKQWVSWVHIHDVVRAIIMVIENDQFSGAVNVTSPHAKQMKDFGKTIGSVMDRPHWFPVPSFMIKAILGKKSSLVLEGQRVVPELLVKNGFDFSYPILESALRDLLK